MPWDTFREWLAYYELEPFGEVRADLRAGIVASVIANANRVKGKAFSPQDFMPDFGGEKPKAAQGSKLGPREPLKDASTFKRLGDLLVSTYRPGQNDPGTQAPPPVRRKPRTTPRHLPPGAEDYQPPPVHS